MTAGVGSGPWNVAVGVVLQFDGGCLCVRFCVEEGPSGFCAFGERGGEEGGEWVREEGVYFGGVQHWLVRGVGIGILARNRLTNLEGVIKNEYDYAVRML